MYHLVCPAKYRRVVIDEKVDEVIRETCLEIEKRYEVRFIEIGTDKDHEHFLIQSVPMYAPGRIVQRVRLVVWMIAAFACFYIREVALGSSDSAECHHDYPDRKILQYPFLENRQCEDEC